MRGFLVASLGLLLAGAACAQSAAQQAGTGATEPAATTDTTSTEPTTLNQAVDRVIAREHQEVAQLRHYDPVIETYIQDMRIDPQLGEVPDKDHYFLGQADLARGVVDQSMLPGNKKSWKERLNPVKEFESLTKNKYSPDGFLQMIYVDPVYFDRQHYRIDYVRRAFLGAVRCLVFDVTPLPKSGKGRFEGRIWVEDQDYTIVRFNGIFVPESRLMGWNLHFDSWRTNPAPGIWVPSYIFSAESDMKDFPFGNARFRSQTRLWGYDLHNAGHEEEFSQLTVEGSKPIEDQASQANGVSPVQAQREWQREGEDDVIDRLQRNGLMAPAGPVDKVMDTVVNNLEVTNNLDVEPEIRCRVLMTSTLESFTIGHTIVLSRGLLDVLPDEASLAMMLAHELAVIVVGQELPDVYAFNDTTMVSTVDTMKRLSFRSTDADEQAAAKKALQLLENSPYKKQLGSAGLFLKQLAAEQKNLPSLISANLGNRIFYAEGLMQQAPQLQPLKLDQIAALPMGARIVLDSWDDSLSLAKIKPVQLLSAHEKLPFEVTPFMPYLTRYGSDTSGDPAPADTRKKKQR